MAAPVHPRGLDAVRRLAAVGGFVRRQDGGFYDIGICYTPDWEVAGSGASTSPTLDARRGVPAMAGHVVRPRRGPSRSTSVSRHPSTASTTTGTPVTGCTTGTPSSTTEPSPRPPTRRPASGSSFGLRARSGTPSTGVGTPQRGGTTSSPTSPAACPRPVRVPVLGHGHRRLHGRADDDLLIRWLPGRTVPLPQPHPPATASSTTAGHHRPGPTCSTCGTGSSRTCSATPTTPPRPAFPRSTLVVDHPDDPTTWHRTSVAARRRPPRRPRRGP